MNGIEGAIGQAFPDIFDGLISTHFSPLGSIGSRAPFPLSVEAIEAGSTLAAHVSEKAFAAAESQLKGSSIEMTGAAAIGLCRRVGDLCRGTYRLVESKDLYAGKVVQRAMLEHHLRLFYLHERYWTEKQDSVGQQYAVASDAEQDLHYAKTLASMERIFGVLQDEAPKSADELPMQQSLRDKKIKLSKISKSPPVFGHRTMIEYLMKGIRNRVNQNALKAYDNPELLAGYLFQYFQLSSFVHGGSHAERDRAMWNSDQRLVPRKMKLLAFSAFQTDLISRCITASLLSAVLAGMDLVIAEMNEKTAQITYENLLRWEGTMAFLE